jgi:hypothetical protein
MAVTGESFGDMGWMDAEGYRDLTARQAGMILVGAPTSTQPSFEAALGVRRT